MHGEGLASPERPREARAGPGRLGLALEGEGNAGGPEVPRSPGMPMVARGGPGGPSEARGGPGRPREGQTRPGRASKARGRTGTARGAQGDPGRAWGAAGRPWESPEGPRAGQGGPGRPVEALGGAGRPGEGRGGPERRGEALGGPVACTACAGLTALFVPARQGVSMRCRLFVPVRQGGVDALPLVCAREAVGASALAWGSTRNRREKGMCEHAPQQLHRLFTSHRVACMEPPLHLAEHVCMQLRLPPTCPLWRGVSMPPVHRPHRCASRCVHVYCLPHCWRACMCTCACECEGCEPVAHPSLGLSLSPTQSSVLF